MMNQNDLISDTNGRLRSRKIAKDLQNLNAPKPNIKNDLKTIHDHALDNDDFPLLCLYCEKTFASKPSLSKHINRCHLNTPNYNRDSNIVCQFCNFTDGNVGNILKHMIESHSDQYFICLDCQTRFSSATELAKHKQNECEKLKPHVIYKSKLRQRCSGSFTREKSLENQNNVNGILPISCELKPTLSEDPDIENNITTNVIIPPLKNILQKTIVEEDIVNKNNIGKHKAANFSFNGSSETDQFLSRLGVVHRSPRNNEIVKRDEIKISDDFMRFEKCFNKVFFTKVGHNIQENLANFLDGCLNQRDSKFGNIIKRKFKKNLTSTVQGFPVLLAPEQCSRGNIDNNIPKTIAFKYKWKWPNSENDKSILQQQFNRDSHTDNCIITAISKLDLWTQLRMRQRFDTIFLNVTKKIENTITQDDDKNHPGNSHSPNTSSQFVENKIDFINQGYENFPFSLGLAPSTPKNVIKPAVLSGEWARPRKYVCCACGEHFEEAKSLSNHIGIQHPNALIDFCEIVGDHLLYADTLKQLHVPFTQISNRNRPLRGTRDCTKCKKPISLEDLHEHMLECAGDTPITRRKCRYRPFGVRRRRPRLPDNTIRKKMRKELRTGRSVQKKHIQPRPKRTDVGDSETIRKMLADLPAKRHRAPITSLNIYKRNEISRKRLRLRQRLSDKKRNKNGKEIKIGENSSKSLEKSVLKRSQKLRIKSGSFIRRNPSRKTVNKIKRDEITNNQKISNTTLSSEHKNNEILSFSTHNDESSMKNNSNDQFSMTNNNDRINVNNGSYNFKKHSTVDGSNSRSSWKQGCNEQNRSDSSKNSSSQKIPLKHSIESLTDNTHTSRRSQRFNQSYLMNEPYITSYTESTHLMPVVHQPLFENEAVVIKLDKPPLFNQPQKHDLCNYQKNKLNKPKKGLNDCIAMLKNKLYEPIPSTSSESIMTPMSPKQPENLSLPQYINPEEVIAEGKVILPAHLSTTSTPHVMIIPLDLSGKSQKVTDEFDVATNLCTKERIHIELKDSDETLDLSNKEQKVVPIDLSVKQVPLDPNFSQKSLDLSIKKINDEKLVTDINLCEKTNEITAVDNITMDLTSKDQHDNNTHTNMIENVKGKNDDSHHGTITSGNMQISYELNITDEIENIETKKSMKYIQDNTLTDPILKVPQYKVRIDDAKSNIIEGKEYSNKDHSETCEVELLPKEIVDILGTMPVQHRNTLLNVLPQVITKTVKQLKLAVDSNVNKESSISTSISKNEIATQTTNTTETCPPEFIDIDTDKYLIDPCTGALTERPQPEKEVLDRISDNKIIDLTSDDTDNNCAPEILMTAFKETITNDNLNVRKQKSNDQTASLRAVRIKSSHDKNKCMKNISLISEIKNQPSDFMYETSESNKNTNIGLCVNKSLSIQQEEESGNHQYVCFVKPAVNTVSILSSNSNNICSVKTEVKKADILHNNNKIDNCVLNAVHNEIIVSSEPTCNNINDVKFNTEESFTPTQSDIIKFENVNIDQNTEKIENQNSSNLIIINDIPNKTTSPKEMYYNDIITIDDKNKNEIASIPINCDDDDPEDNVSLAIIVKQRQAKESLIVTNDPKFESTDCSSTNISSEQSETKRKDKKLKRIKQVDSLNKTPKEFTHSIDDILQDDIRIKTNKKYLSSEINQKDVINNLTVQSDIESKKGKDKFINVELASNIQLIVEDNLPNSNNDTVINITNNTKMQLHTVTNNITTSNNTSITKQINNMNDEHTYNICTDTTKNDILNKNQQRDGIKIFDCCDYDKSKVLDVDDNYIDTYDKKYIQKNRKDSGIIEISESVVPNYNIKELDSSIKMSNTVINQKKSIIPDSFENNLRKSESKMVECVVENKTPIPKKQLIFSKLLLDEEKCTKSLPIENTNIGKDTDCINYDQHTLISDISKCSAKLVNKSESTSEIDTEVDNSYNPSKKRKKISTSKPKTKKKKAQHSISNLSHDIESDINYSDLPKYLNRVEETAKQNTINKKVKDETTASNFPDDTLNTKNNINSELRSEKNYNKDSCRLTETKIEPLSAVSDTLELQINEEIKKGTSKTCNSIKYNNNDEYWKIKSKHTSSEVNLNNFTSDNLKISDKIHKLLSDKDDSSFNLRKCEEITSNSKKRLVPLLKPKAIQVKHKSIPETAKDLLTFNEEKSLIQPSTSGYKFNASKTVEADTICDKTIIKINDTNGNNDSNSDDSFDTPLRKYIKDSKQNDSIDMVEKPSKNKKKLKRRSSVNISYNNLESNELTAEQIKSEQFMESFGFFSERKPRKSNLIAARKISETFHKANESDEVYFSTKRNTIKKSDKTEIKKVVPKTDTAKLLSILSDDSSSGRSSAEPSPKKSKKRRKRKQHKSDRPFCATCDKEFRRPDNLCRHLISTYHIAKVSEKEFNTVPYPDKPNLLVKFKKRFDKLRKLTLLNEKLKKEGKEIELPTLSDIIADITKLHNCETQNISRRGLSRDEALFLDCCEMLKESHKNDNNELKTNVIVNKSYFNNSIANSSTSDLAETGKIDNKSDGDVDSITAQTILESEEVRNLENDLISGLKESALSGLQCADKNYCDDIIKSNDPYDIDNEEFNIKITQKKLYGDKHDIDKNKVSVCVDKNSHIMDNIDIFEDKFDKIKRKCRSQAAAAKQVQSVVEEKVR